jgi:polyisoprenoid-binding protein YceI
MIHPLAVFAAVALTQAPAPRVYSVDPASSRIGYLVTHKLHRVEGASAAVQGKVAFLADGRVQVMVRAPIASFRSGDANRDLHMQEALEASKHPQVTFKAATRLVLPAATPATLTLSLPGELEFHGRKQSERVELKVVQAAAGELRVTGRFEVSLDRYEVERPSLLFVPIDDACRIELDLVLREEAR